MTLYDKNLEFIKKHNIELYNVLNEEPIFNVSLEKCDNEFNYIIERDRARCFIHSIYNIDNELEMSFSNIDKECDTIILFGLGCAYYLEYIVQNYPKVNGVIIIEPCLQMFQELIKNVSIYEYFSKIENITLILNQEDQVVSNVVCEKILEYNNVAMVFNLSYRTVFDKYYNSVMNEIYKEIQLRRGTAAVSNHSLYNWLINSIRNLKQEYLPVESIEEIFKDKPVVIVSAGPSLNESMHLLKEIKDRSIIIAVGTAIKILDTNGIEPHFRAAYDGTSFQMKCFEELNNNAIPLIYSNRLYYEILPEYKGDKYSMTVNSDYIGMYIQESQKNEYLGITTGASIANVITDLVCKLSCSKVIFLGQDMCYTNGEIYAEGSNKNIKHNSSLYIKAENIYGKEVNTNHVFLNMKYAFEYCIKNNPQIRFINATEGGLNIEGSEIKTFKQVIEEDLKEIINIDLRNGDNGLEKDTLIQANRKKINEVIKSMKNELLEIIDINGERLEFLLKLRRSLSKNPKVNRLLNDLSYIEKFDKQLNNNSFYKQVISKELQEKLDALRYTFGYKGKDKMKEIESVEKILTSICIEIQKYAKFSLELIEEYKKEMRIS